MRARFRIVLARLTLAALVLAGPAAAAAADREASRVDVRIVVEPGGSILVTESIAMAFPDAAPVSMSRALPAGRIDRLQVVGVDMDGRALARGRGPGLFEVVRQDGGERRLRWRFTPVARATHVFTIAYRAAGVIAREPAADVLTWRILPAVADYTPACASLDLISPEGAGDVQASVEPAGTRTPGHGAAVRFERCGFDDDRAWVVTARFAARAVTGAAPDWQRRREQAAAGLPLFLGLAGLILAAGLIVWPVFALHQRPQGMNDRRSRRLSPPDGSGPVLGAALANHGRVSWDVAVAALIDLARRQVIRIEEIEGRLLRRRDFAITRQPGADALAPAERTLVALLFEDGQGHRPRVKVSEFPKIFGTPSKWPRFSRAVRSELRARGLIDVERQQTRGRATIAAVGIIVAGFAALVAAAPFVDEHGGAVLTMGAALIVTGLLGIACAQSVTPLTDEAVQQARAWQAYGRHLKDLSCGAVQPLPPDAVDAVLPFAAAFGVALRWAKALRKQGAAAGPSWLGVLAREGTAAPRLDALVALLGAGAEARRAAQHAAGLT